MTLDELRTLSALQEKIDNEIQPIFDKYVDVKYPGKYKHGAVDYCFITYSEVACVYSDRYDQSKDCTISIPIEYVYNPEALDEFCRKVREDRERGDQEAKAIADLVEQKRKRTLYENLKKEFGES